MYCVSNIWLSVYRIWDWVLKLSNISKISVIQLCRIVDSYNLVKAAKSSICRRRPNPVNCCVELTPDSQRWMVGDLESMNNANKISTFVVSRPTVTHTLLPGAHTRFGLRKKRISIQFVACITLHEIATGSTCSLVFWSPMLGNWRGIFWSIVLNAE